MSREVSRRARIEQAAAHNAFVVVIRPDLALCRVMNLFKMYLDPRDRSLAPHLMVDGFWESWVSMFCASVIKRGDVCVDVGANFGYFSLLMGKLSGAKVYAVEPVHRLCELIEMSADINGLDVEVILGAAHDDGSVLMRLQYDQFHLGGTSVEVIDMHRVPFGEGEGVGAIVLDEEIGDGRVDFVKLDCEGSELAALRGMVGILQRNKDVRVLCEYSPGTEGHDDIVPFMGGLGFKPKLLTYDGTLEALREMPKELRHIHFQR